MGGLGIDIGASAVKVLEIEKRGEVVRVVGGGRVKWQTYEPGGDDRALQQRGLMTILSRAGDKYGTAYAGATGRDVNLRFAQIPNVPPAALANLIQFEVQQIKGKTGAVYCDSAVLGAEAGAQELPLLVGLIRTEYADARVNFLSQCGVTPRDVVPNSLALYEVFLQSPECREGETVLLADLGAENIDVVIVEDRRLAFARNINGGGRTCTEAVAGTLKIPLPDAERAKLESGDLSRTREADPRADGVRQALLNAGGQIATMLTSSINFARVQTKRPLNVTRVLLSGGAARLAGLPRFLEDMMKLPVAPFDPFAGWDTSGAGLSPDFFADPSDLTVAAGLALMAAGKPATKLSFLPQSVRDKREFARRGSVAVAGVALLLVAAFVQVVTAAATKKEATGHRDQLKSAKMELESNAMASAELKDNRDKLRSRVDLLNREADAGGFMVRALAAVRETKPAGVWFTEVELLPQAADENLPRGFRVIVKGLMEDPAEGKSNIDEYLAVLKKHPLGVDVKAPKFVKVEGTSLFQFELELK